MKQTNDSFFVDSNVFIYLFGNDDRKKSIAKALFSAHPVISVQVISENINILFKKFSDKVTGEHIEQHKNNLLNKCTVVPFTITIIEKAFELKLKYRSQWYDSVILSAALLYGCTVLYSEDLQHNQLIGGHLKIVNPFI